jgi:hypothetical protein
MTDAVSAYLAELENALQNAPADLRAEILAGVREELDGLPADEVRARLADFGDPAFIAAEALNEAPIAAPVPPHTAALVAVLVMIFGSFLLPVAAGIIGLAWASWSKAWSVREKLVAWSVPVVVVLVSVLATVIQGAEVPHNEVGELINPLMPSLLPTHLGILALWIVFPVEGIVLSARASRRGWRR